MTEKNSKPSPKAKTAGRTSNRRTNESLWAATTPELKAQTLKRNAKADVCVVGAGIAGLTTAYLLALEGKSVIVIDKNSAGQGETINTSAHLSNEIDATYREVSRLHGEKGARLAAQSHTEAISKIESIVSTEGIKCDFARVDGFLFPGPSDSESNLDEELKGRSKRRSKGFKGTRETSHPARGWAVSAVFRPGTVPCRQIHCGTCSGF